MNKLLRADLYRLGRSKLLYGILALTGTLAFLLIMLMRQDIRIGISVVGNLTVLNGVEVIILLGTQYQKGLGMLVAILISVWISQEYQWRTWQHKWIISKSRAGIYLSKAILSSTLSVGVFLLFEVVAVLSSGQISSILSGGFSLTVICGIALYAALGAVICLLAMLIKSNTTSIVVSLFYIVFSETLWSAIRYFSSFSSRAMNLVELGMKHSIYGMSTLISSTAVSADMTIRIVMNSAGIILAATLFGLYVFRKYEL